MHVDINSVYASIPVTSDGSVSFPLAIRTLQEKAKTMSLTVNFPSSVFLIHFRHDFVRPQLCNSSGDFGVAYTALNNSSDLCFVFGKQIQSQADSQCT